MRAETTFAVGSWLLTYLLHSSLLLGAAWLVTSRWARSATVRDLIWKAALVGGLVTATLQTGLAFEPLGGAMALRWDRPATQATESAPAFAGAPDWSGTMLGHSAGSDAPAVEERSPAPVPARPEVSTRQPTAEAAGQAKPVAPSLMVTLFSVAIAGWAVLALMLAALYLLQRHRAMRRIGPRMPVEDSALREMLAGLCQSGGVRSEVRLTVAEGLASPVALGHDEIVLPRAALCELQPEQQRSMLAHELAHLARRDPAWLTFACIMERVFFVQPFNRLARTRLQEAAEYLCDDWAVTRTGSGVSLATCLVKVAEWVHTPPHAVPMTGMAEHRSQLVTRIHRLIEGRTMPSAPRSLWFLAGAVALVGFTAVAAPGITTSGGMLQAQDTVRAGAAATADTNDTSMRRLIRSMSRVQARAMASARRAMSSDRRAMAVAMSPVPPREPSVPLAPALARMDARASDLRAELAAVGRNGRQHDTTSIAVPALMAALKDGDVDVRRAAVQSLSNLDDPRAIPAFIDALRDADSEVRATAANALGQFEDKRSIAPLMAALKDADKDVRRAAISSLGSQGADVPADVVVIALGDKDPEIRQAALSLAQRHGGDDEERPADPRIVQAVVGLIGDPNTDVRSEAISVIGDFRLTQAPASLLAAAKDRDPDVRQHVASALGQIGDAKAVPTLRDMLTDGNSDVREQAVQALGEIRDRSALEALVGALKSSDPVVRRSAAEALGQRDEEQ